MGDWKDTINFGDPTAIIHRVGNKDMEFKPISVGTMFKLRTMAKPIAKAFAVLTSSSAKDTASIFREFGDPLLDERNKPIMVEGKPVRNAETIVEAIDPKLAEMRTKSRSEAIEEIIAAISSDEGTDTLGKIIMESIGLTGNDAPPPKAFFDAITVDHLTALIVGVGKANKGVFGPLTEALTPVLTQVKAGVVEKVSANSQPTQSESGSGSPTTLSA